MKGWVVRYDAACVELEGSYRFYFEAIDQLMGGRGRGNDKSYCSLGRTNAHLLP